MQKLRASLQTELKSLKQQGLYKHERVISSAQNTRITLGNSMTSSSHHILNMCANNYLGLSAHPHVIDTSAHFLKTHGAGLSSVRFICGTQDIHKQLEARIAAFHGMQDAILYPSCFDANAGLFEALLKSNDVIISDALNHASLIDGIRLCKAHRYRYDHVNMHSLREKLQQATSGQSHPRPDTILIATDGVFSMDGELAPLDQICTLAEEFGALVLVDECHATGVFGHGGRGTIDHFNVSHRVHLINSTLGKALGGASGGYTAACSEIVQMLRQRSRPYLFSNSIPPAVVGAAMGAFDIVESAEGDALRAHLQSNMHHFRTEMTRLGFTLRGADHAIVPVMLPSAALAQQFADLMLSEHGVYVIGFFYPVVPKGQARIRVQLSAAHSREDVDRAIHAFKSVAHKLGGITNAASSKL